MGQEKRLKEIEIGQKSLTRKLSGH